MNENFLNSEDELIKRQISIIIEKLNMSSLNIKRALKRLNIDLANINKIEVSCNLQEKQDNIICVDFKNKVRIL